MESGLLIACPFWRNVATQRADVTLFFFAPKKKLKATSSGLLLRSLVRSTRLLAFVHLGLWLIWVGFWTIESSWYRCGLNANLSCLFETLPCFNHLFYKLAVECNCLLVKFQPYARMTRTIMFEEISVYTISCVRCSFYWSTKIYVFRVAVGFQAAPPKGGRVGSTLLWTTFFC